MNISEILIKELRKFLAAPFLFIGSGFSRRYLGTEDWSGLLRRFCIEGMREYEYYFSMANSDLTKTAQLMSDDFSQLWWDKEEYKESRKNYHESGEMIAKSSPLKYEISKFLRNIEANGDFLCLDELEEFGKIVIDGIITTNWDTMLETIFDEYDVYVGQSDLINSNAQEIGDIYKIHGSVTNFNTLVLTEEDYNNFNNRNAYLAAKLLAIFMEHPIFFIGYSISDGNIKDILKSISYCISEDGLKRLENSLFFIEPIFDDSDDAFEKSYINIDSHNIPVTIIRIKDYRSLYIPLQSYERKLSVKRLKQIKSKIYEIVKENDPNGRIGLIDIDDDTDFNDVDFVMGVGVKSLHDKGLVGLCRDDFIEDIVLDNREFNATDIVKMSLPKVLKYEYMTPILKYLRRGGFINADGIVEQTLDERVRKNAYRITTEMNKYAVKELRRKTPDACYNYQIMGVNLLKLQILRDGKASINIQMLEKLLKENVDEFLEEGNTDFNISNFRTTVRIYDWLKFS